MSNLTIETQLLHHNTFFNSIIKYIWRLNIQKQNSVTSQMFHIYLKDNKMPSIYYFTKQTYHKLLLIPEVMYTLSLTACNTMSIKKTLSTYLDKYHGNMNVSYVRRATISFDNLYNIHTCKDTIELISLNFIWIIYFWK